MILLLGALDGEIRLIEKNLSDKADESWGEFPVFRGRLMEQPVVLARTGVGKILAALLTQRLIDRYQPRGIIYTGIAGALNPEYRIGDLVVARDCLQHDMDVTAMGFRRGEIPHSGYRVFPADPDLLEIAGRYVPREGRMFLGRILSGDTYFAGGTTRDFLWELEGDAVEMEGAGAALTAMVNKVPFLLARTISDKADGTSPGGFKKLLRLAAGRNLEFLRYLLANMKPSLRQSCGFFLREPID